MAWVQEQMRLGIGEVQTVQHPNLLLEGVWEGAHLYIVVVEYVGEMVALKDTIAVVMVIGMVVKGMDSEKFVGTRHMAMTALADFPEEPRVPFNLS